MNIAIVEDETIFQTKLMDLIQFWNQGQGLSLNFQCFSSCEQFLAEFQHNFSVIFMDIILPGENGMETAKQIRQKDADVPIIFVTSTLEYATEGYDLEALYYVLKPVKQADINKCMNRIASITASNEYVVPLVSNQIGKFRYSDITYLESQKHYVIIYTRSGQFVCRKKISEAGAELPEIFVQCHRSIIVNINHVVLISRKELTLSTGATVPVSNSYQDDVTKKFIDCTKGNLNWRK